MQTYWDAATKRWLTKLPDGTVRAATNAEATAASVNSGRGPGASVGVGIPTTTPRTALDHPAGRGPQVPGSGDPGIPAPVPRTGDPSGAPDPGRGPEGGAPGTPAPPYYAPLDMTWRNNDQYSVYGRLHGDGSYFQGAGGAPLDTSQQLFYQTGEGRPVAYAKFAGEEADPNSYYYRWLQGQQSRVDNGFKDASVADPNLQYTRYLDQHAKDLYSNFANLPSWQQGYNAPGGFAGRRM